MNTRSAVMSSSPDYLVCLECEAPCYNFEWDRGKLREIQCLVCGNEAIEGFSTAEDLEAEQAQWDAERSR